jgi:hypothetical protein
MLRVVAGTLAVVVVAPIVLSSSDLVRWATDPVGLGLAPAWGWLVFVALDAAAATCVGMVVYSAFRGEGSGVFHVLTWMFAGGSAVANYRHGQTTLARDDAVFFASMSLAGPLLLDAVLSRVRRWIRVDDGRQLAARPRFGLRWLPGVAFAETVRAWQAALRYGISRPADAVAHVQEQAMLRQLPDDADRLRYAFSAIGSAEVYAARRWLTARGVVVDQATVDVVTADRPRPPRPVAPVTPPAGIPVVDDAPPAELDLSTLSKRDAIRWAFASLGDYSPVEAVAWLANRGITVDRREAYRIARTEGAESHLHLASAGGVR